MYWVPLSVQLRSRISFAHSSRLSVKKSNAKPQNATSTSAKVASKKDLQNVSDLAKVAKDNNAKIVVTGYADSKTGSAKLNQKLSEKRAETVANELVKMGVSRDQIETVAAGGVNTLSPINYNRRATVEIK